MLRRLATAFLSLSLLATAVGATPTTSEREAPAMKRPPPVAPSRAAVAKALAARRAKNLAAFRAYRKGGVYPHNLVRSGPLNVWRDAEGHLCAAATMIERDGRDDLVTQVASTNAQLRLLDVTDGPLLDWLLTSGFTLEEIDQIQKPMVRPVVRTIDDPKWRLAEDARLRRLYASTDQWLGKHRKAGLATALDRLMERPELARGFVDATL